MGLGYDSPLVQLESLEREFGGLLREERRGIGEAIERACAIFRAYGGMGT